LSRIILIIIIIIILNALKTTVAKMQKEKQETSPEQSILASALTSNAKSQPGLLELAFKRFAIGEITFKVTQGRQKLYCDLEKSYK